MRYNLQLDLEGAEIPQHPSPIILYLSAKVVGTLHKA